LALSEKNYSDLFHLSPQPMWVFDLDTLRFLNVNSAAIKHYGYSLEEFLSMTIKEIRPKEELDKMHNAIQDSLKPGREDHMGIYKHIKKNGEVIQIQAQSRFIQFNGKKSRLVLANDITEHQNYVDAIEKRNKQLQDIAWIQSHVVRAPLVRIMGLVELFKDHENFEVDKPDLLDKIITSANELDAIIKDISNKTEEVWSNSPDMPAANK
jgi:PAS domain S-box-containing protein